MDPFNPCQRVYQPLLYDQTPYYNAVPIIPISPPTDVFQMQQSPEQEQNPKDQKELPWYVSFGKEIVINGLSIAASMAGGAVGGMAGAIAAGAITSAGLGIFDQKVFEKKQKVDWNSVAIDGALGLVPGAVAESIAKSGTKVLSNYTGKEVTIGEQGGMQRGMVIGATDGIVMGAVGGFSQGAYESDKNEGTVNWTSTLKDTLTAVATAVIGGVIGAGLFMKMMRNVGGLKTAWPRGKSNIF